MRILGLISFVLFSSFSISAQTNNELLIKGTWLKIAKIYAPKGSSKISVFDPESRLVEWPILFQPQAGSELEEIDNLTFHNSLPEVSVNALTELMKAAPNDMKEYKIISFSTFSFSEKERFKRFFIKRYGTDKSILCLTNQSKSPDEYVVIFFVINGKAPRLIGFWKQEYTG